MALNFKEVNGKDLDFQYVKQKVYSPAPAGSPHLLINRLGQTTAA